MTATNVHELTGRDLDRAVAIALGWRFVVDPASDGTDMVWHSPDGKWRRPYRWSDGDPDDGLLRWHDNWFLTGELLELMQPHWHGGFRVETITLLGGRQQVMLSFYRASEELYARGATMQEAVARAFVLWKRDYK